MIVAQLKMSVYLFPSNELEASSEKIFRPRGLQTEEGDAVRHPNRDTVCPARSTQWV